MVQREQRTLDRSLSSEVQEPPEEEALSITTVSDVSYNKPGFTQFMIASGSKQISPVCRLWMVFTSCVNK
jgi:hypothetical protein